MLAAELRDPMPSYTLHMSSEHMHPAVSSLPHLYTYMVHGLHAHHLKILHCSW